VPTYGLTDNERTVSIDRVAGIAVRNPNIVAISAHYGLTVATWVPADPASKASATDCTSWLDVWEDAVVMRFGHRRRWGRTHPAARRRSS